MLFGLYARGRHTAASNVDLLVVYADPPRAEAYAVVRQTLALPRLEPHVYSEAEYRAAQGTVDRMARGGVLLLGSDV